MFMDLCQDRGHFSECSSLRDAEGMTWTVLYHGPLSATGPLDCFNDFLDIDYTTLRGGRRAP